MRTLLTWIGPAVVAIVGGTSTAQATFHEWKINQVYSDASGLVQYVDLVLPTATDDEALEAFVRKSTIGVWHASCSCRMGADGDSMAVTDPEGRVRGVEGLRVVDASIFPLVPCANTNFPTLMTAEKIADAIMR